MMASGSTPGGVPRELIASNRASVPVVGASAIPRIQFSTGLARALQGFSADMFAKVSRVEDALDQQAHAEGVVEGATAGATGEFVPRDYTTIRNRAFNQAGIETFVSTLETKTILQMASLQQLHGSDPVALQSSMTSYLEGVAREIDKVSPGAGATYRQRSALRTLPAVEAARDNAYRATKDQAEAALIESQVAINAELDIYSADLFSDNPARSQAAASAIGLVSNELMRVYDAVDPVTGRPLYSAAEKAKARAALNEKVFENATLSWFDNQDDKAQAYLDFTAGDFTFNIETSVATVPIYDDTGNKIRDKSLKPDVVSKLSTAVMATDPSLSVMVVSGGQDPAGVPGAKRTGSPRHDHGDAADIVLIKDGNPITPEQDPALYERFFENAAASGFTGIGHYPWGAHVGGGSVAAWGPNKSAATLDPAFGAAIARGRENPLDSVGGTQSVDMRKTLSESALASLESEMRSRISFSNSLADREERIAEKALTEAQQMGAFDFSLRMFNAGDVGPDGNVIAPLTRDEITAAVKSQQIAPSVGESMIKALATESPVGSDLAVYNDALQRIEAGEDITQFVLDNKSSLSATHSAKLIEQNRKAIDDPDDETMTESQRGYLSALKDTIAPEGLLAVLDQGASIRAFNAVDEYRKRIAEGEPEADVARDIIERATRDSIVSEELKLQRLLTPRFSTPSDKPGQIDIVKSKASLVAAREANLISEASFQRQKALLLQWHEIQKRLQ